MDTLQSQRSKPTMKVIGLFKEVIPGANQTAAGLTDIAGKLSKFEVISVLEYLKSGVAVFDVMGAERDPLNQSVVISGAASLLSDGYWIWRLDLAYYVEKYQIQLESDFLGQVAACVRKKINEADVLSNWMEILTCYESVCASFKG
ncbi:hypothetical protein J2S30_000686 [Herbaspirillum rubrisubalbicans]|uniref:hypothetical protein n=1 Tax=Herbaspirillum rubrisubalbicans TaxID=80842 RepID=UPI0020A21EE0|nr:hypothetical protein [Herbaspirillum rubrisubalbicans]MCP1572307.1 hypothetical protein [Herbaspirillum rubrisubalbicans]